MRVDSESAELLGRSGSMFPRGKFRKYGLPWTVFRTFSWWRKRIQSSRKKTSKSPPFDLYEKELILSRRTLSAHGELLCTPPAWAPRDSQQSSRLRHKCVFFVNEEGERAFKPYDLPWIS